MLVSVLYVPRNFTIALEIELNNVLYLFYI